MKKLRAGDTLIIKSIDRLGRNYSEILEQWRILTKVKRVAVKVLDMPILSRVDNDLTGRLIADIVLELLSYVAQIERDFIKQRQAEGIAAAQARGVKFGRKPLPRPDNYNDVRALWLAGKISARKAAKLLNISHATFLRWINSDADN